MNPKPSTVLAFVVLGVLISSSILASITSPTGGKANVSWTSETGIGTSVPACSSATPSLSCVAGAPSVNLTGSYDGGHGTCDWADISITGGPSWTNQPCTNWSVNWNGATSNTSYSYNVKYWYDAPLTTVCDAWGEFSCVSWHDENPPPTVIDQYLGSFTTTNCTPLTATCSVAPITANTGENVTWTAVALGGAPTVKQGQDITPDTNSGWTDVYASTLFARRFQATGSYQLQRVAFYLTRSNTTDGTLWVTLESDGGSNPSGTVLATSNVRDAESLCAWGACGNWIAFSFDNYRLTAGTDYWLVLRGSSMVGPTNKILPWANTGGNPAWDSRVRSFLSPSVWSASDQSIAVLVYGPSYTYIWSGDEGLSGTTRIVVKSYSTAGTKAGNVTVNDGTRDAGPFACTNTVSINTTAPTCTASFSPSTVSSSQTSNITWSQTGDADNSIPYTCSGNLGSGALTGTGGIFTTGSITETQTCTLTVQNGSGTNTCPASVTVSAAAATLTGSLSIAPSSGTSPLASVLTATRTGGSAAGTKNYSFWWNCADTTASVAAASASCGSLPAPSAGSCLGNTSGYKCDGISSDTQDTSASGHTYSTSGTAKVIIEQGGVSDQDQKSVTITGGPLSAACDVSPKSVGVGQSVTWSSNPSGGMSPYTFSWTGTDGFFSTLQNPTKTYLTTGQKTASVTVTDSTSANFTSNCSVASGNFGTVYTPTLIITPSSAALSVGGTQQFTATYDADGAGPGGTTNVTNSATWSSDNTPKVTINSTGLATGAAVGSANIGATYSSTTATPVPVTVTSALFCSASPNPVGINAPVTFNALGGTSGNYNWSGGGTPASQNSPSSSFTTRYSAVGNKTVDLTRGSDTASCSVTVSDSGGNGFIEIPPD